jgi:hypothetical protein
MEIFFILILGASPFFIGFGLKSFLEENCPFSNRLEFKQDIFHYRFEPAFFGFFLSVY